MSRAYLLRGTRIHLDNRKYTLLRQIENGVWQLEACDTGELRIETHEALLQRYVEQKLRFEVPIDLSSISSNKLKENSLLQFELLPEEKQNKAKLRRHYVLALLKEVGPEWPIPLVEVAANKVWGQLNWPKKAPPHSTTLWRWVTNYRKSGQDIRSLVDRLDRSGNREARLPLR